MSSDKPLIVSGRVRIRPDRRELAVEAALELVEATRHEEGCLEIRIFNDIADPHVLCTFELWQNVDAMTRHFQTPHLAKFQEQLKRVAIGEPEVKRYLVAA